MQFLGIRLARKPGAPSIRERLKSAAAKILPRTSRKHRKGGGTDTGRRALMTGSLAVAAMPATALAKTAAPVVNLELLRLESEWRAASAASIALEATPVSPREEDERQDLMDRMCEIETAAIRIPAEAPADMVLKFRIFEDAIDGQVGNSGHPQDMMRSLRDDAQHLAALAGGMEGGAAIAARPDPIYTLIEAHRAAHDEMEAASEARTEAEEALSLPHGWASYPEHESRWREDARMQAALTRSIGAMKAEETAFLALLAAIPTASPAGLRTLARHACELTFADEGHAVEGASHAYRALAALAGRPVVGADVHGAFEEDEEDEGDA